MFNMLEWENGNGYTVEVDEVFAITLRDALNEALKKGYGNAVADIYEIDVRIKNDTK